MARSIAWLSTTGTAPALRGVAVVVALLTIMGGFACGDDDTTADAGAGSGGSGGTRDGGSTSHPERDAGAVVALGDAGVLPPATCPTGDCDLLEPDACGKDRGCVLPHGESDGATGPQCAAVGSGSDGDACERSSDCSAGLDCTAFDGTGVCRSYCCRLSSAQDCPDGQFCRISVGSAADPSGAALCDPCDNCNPNGRDDCAEGSACYPLPGSNTCTACLPAGKAKAGATCKLSTDCAVGSACFLLADKTSKCIQFCDLLRTGECTRPQRCLAADGKLPHDLGLCL